MNLEISANLPKPVTMLWLCFEIHHWYLFLIKQKKTDNYCGFKKLLDQGDGSVDKKNQTLKPDDKINPWDPQEPGTTALLT